MSGNPSLERPARRPARAIAVSTLVLSLACAACGASHEGGSGGDSGVEGDAGGGRDAGSLVADCPAAPPTEGAACDHPALECEYGDDWSSACNVLAQCWRGGALDRTWQVREPATTGCPTPTTTGPGCPADPPSESSGCSESDPSTLCVYDDARCLCASLTSDPGGPITYAWRCQRPPEAGCPAERPRIGSACDTEGLTCNYAVCSFGGGTYCTDGAWTEAIVSNACAGGMGGGGG